MKKSAQFDVERIAQLARLDIAPESLERLQHDMSQIVAYIDELKEVDITDVEPTAHAVPLTNVWREDEVDEFAGRDQIMKNAPSTLEDDSIEVPQVLPGEGMS